MSRISEKFSHLRSLGRKGFIPFITAGDPDLPTTGRLLIELERSGADIIELGVPFSDPMADGPAIQRASERALRNGVTIRDCLSVVSELRRNSRVPIVLFSYLNPLLSLGEENIGRELATAGIDGLLVTDLVPEEGESIRSGVQAHGVDLIYLAAPTSSNPRLQRVARSSSGFVYAVSLAGITGVREELSSVARDLITRIRAVTELPIALGFGISTAEHVAEVWRHADAAVVGSRLVSEIERLRGEPDLIERVGSLVRQLSTPPRTPSTT